MAQYDFLLVQNISAGTEFQTYILPKGGTNEVLQSNGDGTLSWVTPGATHIQNTDTGTTNTSFTVSTDAATGKMIIEPAVGAANLTLKLTHAALTDSSKTITFPNTTGTVALTSDIPAVTGLTGTTSTVYHLDSDGYDIELTAVDADNMTIFKADGTTPANLRVGNLTVDGTTTTINSTTLTVDDKNIELGSVAIPSDVTADGGGITLKGGSDKTFKWVDSTDAWTSNQHMDLDSGKVYMINGNTVLSATQVLGVTLGTMAAATATDYMAKSLLTEQGDIIYASAANTPAALPHGTAGQVLQSGGNGANPSWLTILTSVPTSSTAAGTLGMYACDDNYFYPCVKTGTEGNAKWAKIPASTTWS